jgi:hypothetical protein
MLSHTNSDPADLDSRTYDLRIGQYYVATDPNSRRSWARWKPDSNIVCYQRLHCRDELEPYIPSFIFEPVNTNIHINNCPTV